MGDDLKKEKGIKKGFAKVFGSESSPTKKVPKLCGTNYPLSILFIVVNEFCERFSYYGMKAVLTLYFLNYLHWDENLSTTVYHAFSGLCYFTPIIGALIADVWLGKFNTIFWLSILYVIGHVVKSVGAIPTIGSTELHVALSMVGLIAIAFGTGGIKPCVSAFGGDQFEEHHVKERAKFFSIFYLSINAGSLISTLVTPVLRGGVQCFGTDCYALAFGVPAALMFFALIVFVSGSGMYKKLPPEGNVLSQVFKCIGFALSNRWSHRGKQHPKREHWLDWATEKYPNKIITEVKMVTRVLFLYIPLPMFWALFDQQGSRWTLQATRMDTKLGGFVAQPDQIQVMNPLMILILIPVFDLGIYPLLKCCKINFKPIPKMAVGMIVAALAFVVATIVEIQINKTIPPVAKDKECYVQFMNFADTELKLNIKNQEFVVGSLKESVFEDPSYHKIELDGSQLHINIALPGDSLCEAHLNERSDYTLLIYNLNGALTCEQFTDSKTKPSNGRAAVRFINLLNTSVQVFAGEQNETLSSDISATSYMEQKRGILEVKAIIEDEYKFDIGLLNFGAAYTVILTERNPTTKTIEFKKTEDVEANSFHVAWQIPQYVLLSAGEVMFSVTGLEFSYSQAPPSMKSVLQAGWLLTVAFGNVIVLIVAQAGSLEQWAEFILFAALLIAVSIIFSIMGYFYVPVNPDDLKEEDESAGELEKKPLPVNFYEMNIEEKKTKI
ncbi:solute carrier family 15 member 2 [Pelobates fuscus]|uniref:solute carrier family 15 member 2 n=1 Tax=Pelobates fuscus TaxID=191477 RepID=UPI002FE44D31